MQRGRCKVGELGEIVGRRYFCRFQLNSEKSLGSVQRVLSEDVGSNSIHLVIDKYALAAKDSIGFRKFVVKESSVLSCSRIGERWWRKERNGMKGGTSLLCGTEGMKSLADLRSPSHLTCVGKGSGLTSFHRAFASNSKSSKQNSEKRKDISTVEDPFDDITYNIPQKPVTFVEGASYSLVILAGLAIAGAAGYAVFSELIFEPKEYKVFGKALERVQNDGQVKVRIGSPITGYGHESRNRAARQRIPNRQWTDESGVDRIEVNFHIRGPQGAGVVYCEMFKDKSDKKWKFTYVIVDVTSPSPVRLMLESYVPK